MNMHAKRPLRPEAVTTGPLPGASKVYAAPAGFPGLRVPFREIALDPSANEPPVRVYDASGPYTDVSFVPDLSAGLPTARTWLSSRTGLERYEGRIIKPEDNGNVSADGLVPPCPASRDPRRAVGSAPVTQYEFARARHHHGRDGLCRGARESVPRTGSRTGRRETRRRRVVRRERAGLRDARVRARRDRAWPGDHPVEHQPSRA